MDPASRSTPNGRGLNVRRFASEKPNLTAKRTKSPYLIPHVLRLPVALRMHPLLPSSEYVLRRDVGAGAVETDGVLTLDAPLEQPPPIIARPWRSRPDAPSQLTW